MFGSISHKHVLSLSWILDLGAFGEVQTQNSMETLPKKNTFSQSGPRKRWSLPTSQQSTGIFDEVCKQVLDPANLDIFFFHDFQRFLLYLVTSLLGSLYSFIYMTTPLSNYYKVPRKMAKGLPWNLLILVCKRFWKRWKTAASNARQPPSLLIVCVCVYIYICIASPLIFHTCWKIPLRWKRIESRLCKS